MEEAGTGIEEYDQVEEEQAVFLQEGDGTVVADLVGQYSEEEEDEDGEEAGGGGQLHGEHPMVIVEQKIPTQQLPDVFEEAGPSWTKDEDMEDLTGEPQEESLFKPERDDAGGCLKDHQSPVYAVTWNAKQTNTVATGGEDDSIYLWNTISDQKKKLAGHQDSVVSLRFDSSGHMLASGGMDGRVCIWEVATGRSLLSLEGPGEAIEFVDWHPMGPVILAGSEDYTLWMWNASNGACMQVFTGHNESVTCGMFTPDGKTIVSGSLDSTVRSWSPKTGECISVFEKHFHSDGITSLDCSQDSSVLLCGSIDTNAHICNLQTNRVLGKLSLHEDSIETVGMCKCAPLAFTGGLDGKLVIWDCNTLSPRLTCEHEQGVIRCAWHPSLPLIYSACLDAKVRLWDARTGKCERMFLGHEKNLLDISLSPDGNHIITGSDDGSARIFSCI